ncbi:unnamed protein product [Lymnaea stagnalis]|uniref:VWFA domain-containing protein n=1 Tax=Lymnaea stagnalis TaxID=6523 RepID=A0AAV2HKB8_LYMST
MVFSFTSRVQVDRMGLSRGASCLLLLWLMTISHQQDVTCRFTADLVFLIDGSNSWGQRNFDRIIAGVAGAVDSLTFGPNDVRVGAVLFSSNVEDVLDLQTNATDFQQGLMSFDYPDETTYTNLAIEKGIELLFRNPRENVAKILVIVTDGASMSPEQTAYQAAVARSRGIEILGVGIGLDNTTELASLTTGGNQIIEVDILTEFAEQLRIFTNLAILSSSCVKEIVKQGMWKFEI